MPGKLLFLSYSHTDFLLATRLVTKTFEAAGFIVWFDERDLVVGSPSWREALKTAIKQADAHIVIMTPDSKPSVWVGMEYAYADAFDKPIIPILTHGDMSNAVPDYLSDYQFADVTTDYDGGMKKVVAALAAHLTPLALTPAPAADSGSATTPRNILAIENMIEGVVTIPNTPGIRVYIFQVALDGSNLNIVAVSNNFLDSVLDLHYTAGQGVVGQAWEVQQLVFADLKGLPPAELRQIYGFTDEQIKLLADVGSALAVPLRSGSEWLGVLAIDSPLPLNESGFSRLAVQKEIFAAANLIAIALQGS